MQPRMFTHADAHTYPTHAKITHSKTDLSTSICLQTQTSTRMHPLTPTQPSGRAFAHASAHKRTHTYSCPRALPRTLARARTPKPSRPVMCAPPP
eukprot:6175457-Pleurochrysis_carterae.AAC.2